LNNTISARHLLTYLFCRQKMCCFLSVSWGLLSDIDIESERLRMIGEARFTVWAVARVLRNLLNSFYYIEYTFINFINI